MKNNMVKLIALILVFSLFFNVSALNADSSTTDSISKLTEEVTAKLTEISKNEKISVLVYFNDNSDNIVSTMSKEYPTAYEAYIDSLQQEFVSSNEKSIKNEEITTYSSNLQNAIEIKRKLYKSHYETSNALALAKSCKEESIMYISSYAPIAITTVTKSELKQLISNTSVKKISLFNNNILSVSSLENANLNSRADYVRDSLGNDGSGVKIGQVEPAVPSKTDTYLSSSNIITNTSFGGSINSNNTLHATYVARIMVGNGGLAPSATLYAASASDELQIYNAIDWLVSQGVNVINMSANLYLSRIYDDLCAYVDHLAVQHDVHFVVSAGNVHALSPNHHIVSPGMAYNAITVGAYNDNATAPANDTQIYAMQKDDYIETYSKYLEFESSDRPCKPNLVASGNDFWGESGTSFAAPQVTGVIAQLCSYNPSLKTKQTCIGAILAASCGRKLSNEVQPGTEIVSSGSFKGGDYTSDASIYWSANQISNVQGAGKLDAYWARSIVASGTYWSLTIDSETTTYSKNVYITKGSETLTRIAIYWLKRNSVDSQYNISQLPMADWELTVYGPDDLEIKTSMTYYSNYEIVQFVPPTSGTYRIEIRKADYWTDASYVGIAVW